MSLPLNVDPSPQIETPSAIIARTSRVPVTARPSGVVLKYVWPAERMWNAPQASAARPSLTSAARQSTTRAFSAPYRYARSGTLSRSGSSYWPRSAVYAYGMAPWCRIQATATEVSRPPENAIPTRSPTGSEVTTLDMGSTLSSGRRPDRTWTRSRGLSAPASMSITLRPAQGTCVRAARAGARCSPSVNPRQPSRSPAPPYVARRQGGGPQAVLRRVLTARARPPRLRRTHMISNRLVVGRRRRRLRRGLAGRLRAHRLRLRSGHRERRSGR